MLVGYGGWPNIIPIRFMGKVVNNHLERHKNVKCEYIFLELQLFFNFELPVTEKLNSKHFTGRRILNKKCFTTKKYDYLE